MKRAAVYSSSDRRTTLSRELFGAKKSRLPVLKVAWYTLPNSRCGPPRSRRLRRRLQAHGNVQSLLEAFRPNGFDRRLPGIPKAVRGAHDDLRGWELRKRSEPNLET